MGDTLKNIIFIACVLGTLAFGYLLMVRLDRFLNENRKTIEAEDDKEEPARILLTDELSDEEIADEVRKFRKSHKSARVVLYDSSGRGLPDSAAPREQPEE